MAQDAAGRTRWFVTGTSAGLGKALAEAIVAQGDRLVATARTPDTIAYLANGAEDRVRTLPLDVTVPESVEAGVAAGIAAFGGIDILVNNAAVGCVGAIEECVDEDLWRVYNTNVFGTLRVTRAMLPHFRAQRSGRIITMSSASGILPSFGFGIYSSSKHALEGAFECLAAEVKPLGIAVTIVEPGLFKSDFRARNIGRAPTLIEDYREITWPLRERTETPHLEATPDPPDLVAPILGVARLADPPLRLPVTLDAWARIRERTRQRAEETEALWARLEHDLPSLRSPV
jgi:NAD(P)-dependent dehydrogenase (short-subunit alcohol dehydrogenase family)